MVMPTNRVLVEPRSFQEVDTPKCSDPVTFGSEFGAFGPISHPYLQEKTHRSGSPVEVHLVIGPRTVRPGL